MFPSDYTEFTSCLHDLCVSVNRPFNDDMVRVFWEDLKRHNISEIKERAKFVRACGKRSFSASDLRPEKVKPPPADSYKKPEFEYDHFHCFGQRQFFRFLQQHDVQNDQLPDLVRRKNEIIAAARNDPDFRGRDPEEMASELKQILWGAWGKAVAG